MPVCRTTATCGAWRGGLAASRGAPSRLLVHRPRAFFRSATQVETADGATGMCILPTKYRKLIWVKRGDFLIAHKAGDDVETATGARGTVNFRVEHVLGEPQVGFLQLKGLW